VYTSPLERAVETAAEIARPHALEPQPVEEFGEFHAGEWQGMSIAELDRRDDWQRFNRFRAVTRAPGGELMIETQARMVRQLDRLRGRHHDEMVAVVSHADPLRAAAAYYLGISLDQVLRLEIHTASVSVLQLAEWGARILCLNHKHEIPLEGS
jgi:probable phosphoglycerate mutase